MKIDHSFSRGDGAWSLPGLAELHAETGGGDPRICIAVLDGPVDLTHPAFSGARIDVLDTAVPSGSAHGTHVASLLFGQPGGPVAGIAPRCRGLVVPVYEQGEDGSLLPCRQIDLARAIQQAVAWGAHVINISGGELTGSGEADHYLAEAVRRSVESGVLIVAAAGNDGCECLHVPAALPSVLSVGALGAGGRPLFSSNWGGVLARQGIMAPGEGILGAVPGGTARMNGTSFATPVVSGAAALLLSRQIAAGRNPEPSAVREAILAAALPCEEPEPAECPRFLAGKLDIPGARVRLGLADSINPDLGKERQMQQEEPAFHGVSAHAAAEPGEAPTAGGGISPSCACQGPEPPAGGSAGGSALTGIIPSQSPRRSPCGPSPETPYAFALGSLGYDFGCEARLDYFVQQLGNFAHAFDPVKMAEHLDEKKSGHPEDANALIWTLNIDGTPVYAIEPEDQFAVVSYVLLTRFLVEQELEGVERIAIAGQISGARRLYNGTVVPVIAPVTRGMFNWSAERLVNEVLGPEPAGDKGKHKSQAEGIRRFLDRIYYELRNLGTAPQERAMNFAATNAFQVKEVYGDAVKESLQLDAIAVEKSPICRPDSDCWDVKLTFFDPAKRFERARKIYRYTVDVSDIVPVTVGTMRSWYAY